MSAYRLQLSDARNATEIKNIAGKCSNSEQFANLVNVVTRRLLKRGAWWGTEVVVRLCIFGCEIVWPNFVGTVKGVRTCSGPMNLRNNSYAIMGPVERCYDWGASNWPAGTGYGYGGNVNAVGFDSDTACTGNAISGNTGKFLRYHIVNAEDIGKTITFYGKQYGGQPLQEQISGVTEMGLTLTAVAGANDAQTTQLVTKLDQITRERTVGMTYLYEFDSATSLLRTLSIFQPNETNPQYRKTTIQNFGAIPYYQDANGVKSWNLEALVKLEYIPAELDRDFLLIDDFDALKLGIQALQFEDAHDYANAEVTWKLAIRELNYESRNKQPGNQFVVRSRVMGSNRIVSNPI